MAYIKVCPKCQIVYPSSRTECSNCHKDLTKVNKIDEQKYAEMQEKAKETKENVQTEGGTTSNNNKSDEKDPPRMVYICETCGEPNGTQNTVCSKCGDSLAGIVPVPWEKAVGGKKVTTESNTPDEKPGDENPPSSLPKYAFKDETGSFSIEFSEGSTRLGQREVASEFLSSKEYVSGFHAVVTVENGACFIEDFSTNGTFINGSRIEKNKKVRIVAGQDLIGLGSHRTSDFLPGAAYFRLENR